MIIGADAVGGDEIVSALKVDEREVRAFVSDLDRAKELRSMGVKVAYGDVSDDSHIETACTNCFSAVLLASAATDDRERAFATEPGVVWSGWSRAVSNAGLNRAIWVTDETPPPTPEVTTVTVSPTIAGLGAEVARLDDLAEL